MGWKYLHRFLENFAYIIFCYILCSLCFLFLLVKRQQCFLWIILYIIAIQEIIIIRGLVKIKYTIDQFFLLSLKNHWSNTQIPDFWHYNALIKNTDHGISDTNICLVIIYLSVFFLLIFCSCKLRYREMLTSCGSFLVQKRFLFSYITW